MGWKSETITSSHHLLIVTFLKVSRRPWDDMKIIYAISAGSVISEGFGKIFAIPGRLLVR
jgi:hypothetical protein